MSKASDVHIQFKTSTGTDIARQLAKRQDLGDSPGLVARRDLELFYALQAEALQQIQLSEAEAMLLCDILNGSLINLQTAQWLDLELADALPDGYAAKWGVDGAAMLATVRSWTTCQRVAVVEAVRCWWIAEERDAQLLRQLGLVRGPQV